MKCVISIDTSLDEKGMRLRLKMLAGDKPLILESLRKLLAVTTSQGQKCFV